MLHGLRILELAHNVAGPFAGKLLADLGAEVIKVEPPGAGDPSRRSVPWQEDGGIPTPRFLYLNTGKQSVTLDPAASGGRELFLRLAGSVDAIIEDADDLGRSPLAYAELCERWPNIVLASASSFGCDSGLPRHPALCEYAAGGMLFATGERGEKPVQTPNASQYLEGTLLASGIVAALLRARRGGGGDHVDVSGARATLSVFYPQVARYSYQGAVGGRSSPSVLRRTADGWMYPPVGSLRAQSPEQAARFMGLDSQEGPGASGGSRTGEEHGGPETTPEERASAVDAYFAAQRRYDAFHAGQAAGLVWSVLQDPGDLVTCAQLESRGFLRGAVHPVAGALQYPANPVQPAESRPRLEAAPGLGEHNERVYGRLSTPRAERSARGVRSEVRGAALPLTGVRVVAVEQIWAGPLASMELAALGADVIKVESAYRPDSIPGRRVRMGAFSQLNRNKRGISLDLRREEGRALFRGLVATADVVIENFLRRTLAGFGLDYAALSAVKPDLIMLSSTGYGHSGPYGDYRAVGPNLEAMSGMAWRTHHPGGEPRIPGAGAFGDTVSGHFGVLGILAALLRRDETGAGAHIDLSQYEGLVAFAGEEIVAQQLGRQAAHNHGNEHPWMVPHGVYACRGESRWIALAAASDEQWRSLCRLMGDPGWACSAALDTRQGRLEQRDEIDACLEAWTRSMERDALVRLLRGAGVFVAPVQDARDVVLDAEFWRQGAVELVDLGSIAPDIGVAPHNGAPWRFERTPLPLQRTPPVDLGVDNMPVFRDLLGLGEPDVARLENEGVASRTPLAAYPRMAGDLNQQLPAAEQFRRGTIIEYDADFREQIAAAAGRAGNHAVAVAAGGARR